MHNVVDSVSTHYYLWLHLNCVYSMYCVCTRSAQCARICTKHNTQYTTHKYIYKSNERFYCNDLQYMRCLFWLWNNMVSNMYTNDTYIVHIRCVYIQYLYLFFYVLIFIILYKIVSRIRLYGLNQLHISHSLYIHI